MARNKKGGKMFHNKISQAPEITVHTKWKIVAALEDIRLRDFHLKINSLANASRTSDMVRRYLEDKKKADEDAKIRQVILKLTGRSDWCLFCDNAKTSTTTTRAPTPPSTAPTTTTTTTTKTTTQKPTVNSSSNWLWNLLKKWRIRFHF